MDAEKLKELVTQLHEGVEIRDSHQGLVEIPHAEAVIEAAYKAGMQVVAKKSLGTCLMARQELCFGGDWKTAGMKLDNLIAQLKDWGIK